MKVYLEGTPIVDEGLLACGRAGSDNWAWIDEKGAIYYPLLKEEWAVFKKKEDGTYEQPDGRDWNWFIEDQYLKCGLLKPCHGFKLVLDFTNPEHPKQ